MIDQHDAEMLFWSLVESVDGDLDELVASGADLPALRETIGVHDSWTYDLRLDSSVATPLELAERVLDCAPPLARSEPAS